MPRKESEAVPEGNGPVPQQEEFGSGEPTLADVYRFFKEEFDRQQKIMDRCFDRQEKMLDEIIMKVTRRTSQRASLEHDTRQPHLAMEADANTKTRERTEGAPTAVQTMRGDSFSARGVESSPKTNSTSVGMRTEPPALPCWDDVLVQNGDASPKSYIPFLEIRSLTAAGGLLPTGEASTATRTTFNEPPLRIYSTEETDSTTNLRTRIPYVS